MARRRAPAKDMPTGDERTASPTGSDVASGSSAGDLYERIRQRAYELWESEGRPQGRDREHWERAERELSAGAGAGGQDAPSPAARGSKGRAATPAAAPSSEDGGRTEAAADLGDSAPEATRRRRRTTPGGA